MQKGQKVQLRQKVFRCSHHPNIAPPPHVCSQNGKKAFQGPHHRTKILGQKPNFFMWEMRSAAMLAVKRCRTRGASEESIASRWQSMQARDPPWLWNPGQTSSEVQNRGISGPSKRTHVLLNFFFKKDMNFILRQIYVFLQWCCRFIVFTPKGLCTGWEPLKLTSCVINFMKLQQQTYLQTPQHYQQFNILHCIIKT